MGSTTESTRFSRDIFGRYICNSLDEALASTDRGSRREARPFDVIVLGGGSIGGALAQHLFAADMANQHRILVLDGGPFLLPEHLQNMPMSGLQIYGPPSTSIKDLRDAGQYGMDKPRDEVWGLPWHSNHPSPGIAYCLGGRSLMWGGWSPVLLADELQAVGPDRRPWPEAVARDLTERYFDEASRQLGSRDTNDFIHGELHEAVRKVLYAGLSAALVDDAIPLDELPTVIDDVPEELIEEYKLEAPLAVQARTRPGWFPMNKYSSVPLLMQAAREAWQESQHDDVKKRLMVVPNCHIRNLQTVREGDEWRVTGVETNLGYIPVPDGGVVVNALGTVESTRLAQISFPELPNASQMGRNLTADLISLLVMRVPRSALPVSDAVRELQTAALLLRGRHTHVDGAVGHFHLQITGSGLGPWDFNAEAELYRKVPDLDTLDAMRFADDTHVVIVILGVAKMEPDNEGSRITLDPEADEFGEKRAFVRLEASTRDLDLLAAMDEATDQVARIFANGQPYEVYNGQDMSVLSPEQSAKEAMPFAYRHFGLGDSHHEAGTMRIGTDPASSVCDETARLHHVKNAYVASPALFPTNAAPVLTGVALGRRLADHLAAPVAPEPDAGFSLLFEGTRHHAWTYQGDGTYFVVDHGFELVAGGDLGLLWCQIPTPRNYVLKLEWLRWHDHDNGGVYLRFPNPWFFGYQNPAYVPVHFGYEVQIDEAGAPDGQAIHRTGAIYGQPGQSIQPRQARPPGVWNEFEIHVQDRTYSTFLNGEPVATFTSTEHGRGEPSADDAPTYVGLQAYPGSRTSYRRIQLKPLPD